MGESDSDNDNSPEAEERVDSFAKRRNNVSRPLSLPQKQDRDISMKRVLNSVSTQYPTQCNKGTGMAHKYVMRERQSEEHNPDGNDDNSYSDGKDNGTSVRDEVQPPPQRNVSWSTAEKRQKRSVGEPPAPSFAFVFSFLREYEEIARHRIVVDFFTSYPTQPSILLLGVTPPSSSLPNKSETTLKSPPLWKPAVRLDHVSNECRVELPGRWWRVLLEFSRPALMSVLEEDVAAAFPRREATVDDPQCLSSSLSIRVTPSASGDSAVDLDMIAEVLRVYRFPQAWSLYRTLSSHLDDREVEGDGQPEVDFTAAVKTALREMCDSQAATTITTEHHDSSSLKSSNVAESVDSVEKLEVTRSPSPPQKTVQVEGEPVLPTKADQLQTNSSTRQLSTGVSRERVGPFLVFIRGVEWLQTVAEQPQLIRHALKTDLIDAVPFVLSFEQVEVGYPWFRDGLMIEVTLFDVTEPIVSYVQKILALGAFHTLLGLISPFRTIIEQNKISSTTSTKKSASTQSIAPLPLSSTESTDASAADAKKSEAMENDTHAVKEGGIPLSPKKASLTNSEKLEGEDTAALHFSPKKDQGDGGLGRKSSELFLLPQPPAVLHIPSETPVEEASIHESFQSSVEEERQTGNDRNDTTVEATKPTKKIPVVVSPRVPSADSLSPSLSPSHTTAGALLDGSQKKQLETSLDSLCVAKTGDGPLTHKEVELKSEVLSFLLKGARWAELVEDSYALLRHAVRDDICVAFSMTNDELETVNLEYREGLSVVVTGKKGIRFGKIKDSKGDETTLHRQLFPTLWGLYDKKGKRYMNAYDRSMLRRQSSDLKRANSSMRVYHSDLQDNKAFLEVELDSLEMLSVVSSSTGEKPSCNLVFDGPLWGPLLATSEAAVKEALVKDVSTAMQTSNEGVGVESIFFQDTRLYASLTILPSMLPSHLTAKYAQWILSNIPFTNMKQLYNSYMPSNTSVVYFRRTFDIPTGARISESHHDALRSVFIDETCELLDIPEEKIDVLSVTENLVFDLKISHTIESNTLEYRTKVLNYEYPRLHEVIAGVAVGPHALKESHGNKSSSTLSSDTAMDDHCSDPNVTIQYETDFISDDKNKNRNHDDPGGARRVDVCTLRVEGENWPTLVENCKDQLADVVTSDIAAAAGLKRHEIEVAEVAAMENGAQMKLVFTHAPPVSVATASQAIKTAPLARMWSFYNTAHHSLQHDSHHSLLNGNLSAYFYGKAWREVGEENSPLIAQLFTQEVLASLRVARRFPEMLTVTTPDILVDSNGLEVHYDVSSNLSGAVVARDMVAAVVSQHPFTALWELHDATLLRRGVTSTRKELKMNNDSLRCTDSTQSDSAPAALPAREGGPHIVRPTATDTLQKTSMVTTATSLPAEPPSHILNRCDSATQTLRGKSATQRPIADVPVIRPPPRLSSSPGNADYPFRGSPVQRATTNNIGDIKGDGPESVQERHYPTPNSFVVQCSPAAAPLIPPPSTALHQPQQPYPNMQRKAPSPPGRSTPSSSPTSHGSLRPVQAIRSRSPSTEKLGSPLKPPISPLAGRQGKAPALPEGHQRSFDEQPRSNVPPGESAPLLIYQLLPAATDDTHYRSNTVADTHQQPLPRLPSQQTPMTISRASPPPQRIFVTNYRCIPSLAENFPGQPENIPHGSLEPRQDNFFPTSRGHPPPSTSASSPLPRNAARNTQETSVQRMESPPWLSEGIPSVALPDMTNRRGFRVVSAPSPVPRTEPSSRAPPSFAIGSAPRSPQWLAPRPPSLSQPEIRPWRPGPPGRSLSTPSHLTMVAPSPQNASRATTPRFKSTQPPNDSYAPHPPRGRG